MDVDVEEDASDSVFKLSADVVGSIALSFPMVLSLFISLSSPLSIGLGLGSLESRRNGKVTFVVILGIVDGLG